MSRPAMRAACALLLSTMTMLSAPRVLAALPRHAAPTARMAAAPSNVELALQAAYLDIAAGKDQGSYGQWLDTLPNFQFSPATARLLVGAFGTDRLFSVERLPAAPGVHDYSLSVPARRQAGADGGMLDWATMHGQLTAQADGVTLITKLSAPAFNRDDMAMRVAVRDIGFAAISRRSIGALPLGGGRLDIGSIQGTVKPLAVDFAMTGVYSKSITADQGRTVAMQYEAGVRTVEVAGEKVEDLHFRMHVDGVDKAALEAIAAQGSRLGMQSANAGPLLQQLGAVLLAKGATFTFDDISLRYRGSLAHMHGQFHVENATADDLARPETALRKIVAHVDIAVPAAMLHAFAEKTARDQLAKQGNGNGNAAAVVKAGQDVYDGLLRQAVAAGWVRVQGDMLVSNIDVRNGVVLVNGKPVQLPQRRATAPAAAVDSRARFGASLATGSGPGAGAGAGAGYGSMTPPRRIDEQCALPAYPREVLLQDRALEMTLRLSVAPDGSVADARLAPGSGIPAYDTAVLAAAAHCRYLPARQGGRAVMATSRWDIVRAPGSLRP